MIFLTFLLVFGTSRALLADLWQLLFLTAALRTKREAVPMKILVVEDDAHTREFLEKGLQKHGFVVDFAKNCSEASKRTFSGGYDVLVLDVMLPDGEGFDLYQELCAAGVRIPTLFLSARGEVTDRLRGFELGADDYLKKPFAFAELLARIHAVARRRPDATPSDVLRIGDLVLDVRRHTVERAGQSIALSHKQFSLLEYFMRNPGLVLSRGMLIEKVWGYGFETRSNAVDVQIKVLRERIDRDFTTPLLHTVRGAGYVLEERKAYPDTQTEENDGES